MEHLYRELYSYSINCVYYTQQKLNMHIVILNKDNLRAGVEYHTSYDSIRIDLAMFIKTGLQKYTNYEDKTTT